MHPEEGGRSAGEADGGQCLAQTGPFRESGGVVGLERGESQQDRVCGCFSNGISAVIELGERHPPILGFDKRGAGPPARSGALNPMGR